MIVQWLRRAMLMCSLPLVAGFSLSANLRGADPDKKAEEQAEDKKEQTPEEWAAQIEKDLMIGLRGGDKGAVETFNKSLAEFVAKNPTSQAQWKLKMLDVQLGMMAGGARPGTAKKSAATLAEIVASKEAPEQIREQASIMRVRLADNEKPEEVIKAVEEHLAAFPDSKMNKRLAQMAVMSIGEGEDEEKSLVKLEPLVKHANTDIAAAAKTQVEQLKALLELKLKPLEMKFTAVDGTDFDMNQFRGKVVLIDFWATWCGPCVAELPHVKEVYDKLHEKGFEIVGISFDQEKDKLTKFVADKEMPWPQYYDGKGWENEFGTKYGIRGIPAMWLVGKDGKVASFKGRGELMDKVEKLLAQ